MNIKQIALYSGVGIVGVGVGYALGYYQTKGKLLKEFSDVMEKEIEALRNYAPKYSNNSERPKHVDYTKKSTPQETFEALHGKEELEKLVAPYQSVERETQEEERVVPNIFENTGIPGYDPDLEDEEEVDEDTEPTKNIFDNPPEPEGELEEVDGPVEIRDTSKPYILAYEDFMVDDEDIDKISITYYEDDDTLADERDQIIPDVEGSVGAKNLHRFGHKSQDPNILYVRNERLHTDFEITLNKGSYSKIVLGFDPLPKERKSSYRLSQEDD